jgi:hypothetical protein
MTADQRRDLERCFGSLLEAAFYLNRLPAPPKPPPTLNWLEKPPRGMSKETAERVKAFNEHFLGHTTVTFAELLQFEKPFLEDGRHLLLVTKLEARGQSILMHVERESDGAAAEVTLGSPGQARDRRLRLLLGRSDFDNIAELREALLGQHIYVKLTTYGFGTAGRQREYRGVERA